MVSFLWFWFRGVFLSDFWGGRGVLCLLKCRLLLSLLGGELRLDTWTFPLSASPPAASRRTTISNRGWKEGAEAVSRMLLEIPHGTNELFTRNFLKKVPCLQEVGEAEMMPTVPRGQEGTTLSYQFPICCELNSLLRCLQVSQHAQTLKFQMLSLLTSLQMWVMSDDFTGTPKICSNLIGKKTYPTALNRTCKRSGFYGNKRSQEKIL